MTIFAEKRKPDLVLDNGLKIFYISDDKGDNLSLNMIVGTKTKEDSKEVIFAINHLIEHCLRIEDPEKAKHFEQLNVLPKDCQTSYDKIEYRKKLQETQNTAQALDCYGELFSNWSMPHLDAEKNVIFEEWCYVYNQKEKWKFLSNYLGKDQDKYLNPQLGHTLLKDEYIQQNQDTTIKKWFNDQINYTQDFTPKDITDYAKHIYGADNMAFVCSGNMPKDEFLSLVKQSNLNKIPVCQNYNPLENTKDTEACQNLESNLNINDFGLSSINLVYNIENKDQAKIAKEFLKIKLSHKLQKEAPNAYIVDFTNSGINTKISSSKEKILRNKLVSGLSEITEPNSISDKELNLVRNKTKNSNISKENLYEIASYIFETAQIVTNEKEAKSLKILAHINRAQARCLPDNESSHHSFAPQSKAPFKSQRISTENLKSLQRAKESLAVRK